jgi:hypothetical protein
MTYEAITTHPDGTRTIDLDGKTYRAEIDKAGDCAGCAFDSSDRFHDCGRVDCAPDGGFIIWVPQQ